MILANKVTESWGIVRSVALAMHKLHKVMQFFLFPKPLHITIVIIEVCPFCFGTGRRER